jgi:transposase, IS30 family
MPKRIHPDVEREVRRLAAKGHKLREIGRILGFSRHAVTNTLRREPLPTAPAAWSPASGRLSLEEREEIRVGLEGGDTLTAIAGRLSRSVSTVSREVAANGGRAGYRAHLAHQRAFERSRRPKTPKLACECLAAKVAEWLQEWWSPEEISARLRMEFPDDPMMWVSHETIYMSLFVEGRGQLRRELSRCLRTGRAQRRPRSRIETRGKIPGMVMISERPAEAEDRAVPGHWEGDLIIGEGHRSAVGTLVERASRYVMLLHLPDGRDAEKVNEAMTIAIMGLPDTFRRTITWDQGREMSAHARFTIDTGIQIYFCDPHSPWQRPSNENTNGLLRQYMPKGTDLSVHSAEDLQRFAISLNNRPRKALGFMKPSEKFAELLALTG